MSGAVEIHGFCDPAFEAVRQAFQHGFESGQEVGASVAVTRGEDTVVDLWAGYKDAKATARWEENTLTWLASTTKMMTGLCVVMLIDQGRINPDAPVVEYWPEFGKHGKERVLVRHFFNHSAGVPGIEPAIPFSTVYDWPKIIQALENQALWWEPGEQSGYHSETFGFLAGELVRRITGLTPGKFLKQEVTAIIGADFFIGFPRTELGRLSLPIQDDEEEPRFEAGSIGERATSSFLPPAWEGIECLENEIPGSNGIGNARSVARIGAIYANHGELAGHRFLSRDSLDLMLTEQSYRNDLVFDMPIRLGFGLGLNSREFECPGDQSLHWGGRGGSICVMDLASKTCLAYAPNRWLPGVQSDPRNERIRLAYNDVVS
jgi:CubicO group peptidase (beta-lactamase class C family)